MLKAIGIKCEKTPNEIMDHFETVGAEAILFDPDYICGKDHLLSAYIHAERAMERGTNRSRDLVSETILYASADRQIGRAIKKMSPKKDSDRFVVLIIGNCDDFRLEDIEAERDDSLIDCTEESAKNMNLEKSDIPYTELILEHVAAVDIMKF
ncbi:MAG: KEOPS complex subunit Cgi121 [Candidatus Methanomethylophilaceae archaeon]|jgi:KEOPS complex subunit Cgi121